MNPYRYGLTTRIGAGNLSVYGYYSLIPVFEKGKGPNDGKGPYNEVTNYTVGLTLAIF